LAGLATEFNRISENDVYLFGIWKDDLHRQLLWKQPYYNFNEKIECISNPIRDCLIPSWTWASVDGPVVWSRDFFPGMKNSCLTAFSHFLDSDQMQSAATLSIRGPLFSINAEKSKFHICTQDRKYFGYKIDGGQLTVNIIYHLDHWYLKCYGQAVSQWSQIPETLIFLPILGWLSANVRGAACLLLWRDSKMPKGMYRRAGFATMHTILGSYEAHFDFVEQCFRKYHAFIESDGAGQYTISLC
jgi:hypothetical protein